MILLDKPQDLLRITRRERYSAIVRPRKYQKVTVHPSTKCDSRPETIEISEAEGNTTTINGTNHKLAMGTVKEMISSVEEVDSGKTVEIRIP